jgi:hypothetical protein
MQDKVAVGEAVKAGYRFAFGDFRAVFGAAWLPLLVAAAVTIAVSLAFYHSQAIALRAIVDPNAGNSSSFVPLLAAILIETVVGSIATVGLISIALGRRAPSSVYFSLGPDVRRMMAANVLAAGIIIALFVALVLVFAIAGYALGTPSPNTSDALADWLLSPLAYIVGCGISRSVCSPPVAIGLILLLVFELSVLIYLMLRLTFFLPAVVVFEKRIGLKRAWALARGNFWRIFAITLGLIAPLMIAQVIVEEVSMRMLAPVLAPGIFGGVSQERALLLALDGMAGLLIVRSIIRLVCDCLFGGLSSGAAARAYFRVTMADAPDVF